MRIRNTFIIFVVSGFWHGANWTFIVWGALNALYMVPLVWFKTNRRNIETVAQGKLLPNLIELSQMILTFGLTVLAWIFFRAESLTHAFEYISNIFSPSLLAVPEVKSIKLLVTLLLVLIFMTVEWLGREDRYAIEKLQSNWPRLLRWSFYALVVLFIGLFMHTEESPFIYFQF